jgi:hypothetical protein
MANVKAFPLAYCDYIGNVIQMALNYDAVSPLSYVSWCGNIQNDLDAGGALASTTKTLTVSDVNGKLYDVIIREVL